MENINFRGIPTSLFLNGPKLGIVTDPQNQSNVVSIATFTGIATASFPDPADGVNDGTIEFKWYFDGSQILDSSVDEDSFAEIIGFSSATGTGSTITIGLSADDDGKEIYFTADYVPSAYSQPAGSAVTAGTARSTGNAFNEPLQSGIGTISIQPKIEFTSQPESRTVGRTFDATYSVAAKTTPGDGSVDYQWQLNGNDLSDGTSTTTVSESTSGQIQVTNDTNSDIQTIDFSEVSSYDAFTPGTTYTLTANQDLTAKVFAVGSGGGFGQANRKGKRFVSGSKGGSAEGTFTFVKDQAYRMRVAEPGGQSLGGELTGLFIDSITHANSIIIGGGGGGSTGRPGKGGNGGGLTGQDGGSRGGAGSGGTQTAGGAGGNKGQQGGGADGIALEGFGSGGDGYYGGGQGRIKGAKKAGPGGGGSGYLHPTLISDGEFGVASEEEAAGEFRIESVSTTTTVTTTVTGSTTENLTISSDGKGSGVIRCKVTADNVQESPVFSKSVSYYVVDIRNVIKIEQYDYANATATLSENDLSDGSLSLSYDSHPGNAICLYAGEQDIDVEIDMYGGKGDDNGSNLGGEGGYSKIRFTMEKDVEYILTGLFSAVNAPFLYRKATLIAIVGEGGDAGAGGHGGDGGGINVKGEDTTGGSGNGGDSFAAGTLPSNGYYGSLTTLTAVTPDTEATGVDGGRTLPCPRGDYWRDQGKSPCEDLGTIKFRTPDGTEISNTAEIARGYKSGYNIIQTKGAQDSGGGQGGTGALGGQGGTANGGGGGGSGYTDGSVTVVQTSQGGSTGPARINIKLSAGNFFIDDQGRILIYASTDARDPETGITKTTEMVNYGDNACIDDARWQRFLDLARDGTQDYRLTATENNSTVKITNATEKNIYKMMNANQHPLSTSLTDWYNKSYAYDLRMLAWDETSGSSVTGSDYSMLSWSPAGSYGYGFYGSSSNSFFTPTVYGYKTGINFWILPPGVPDF